MQGRPLLAPKGQCWMDLAQMPQHLLAVSFCVSCHHLVLPSNLQADLGVQLLETQGQKQACRQLRPVELQGCLEERTARALIKGFALLRV